MSAGPGRGISKKSGIRIKVVAGLVANVRKAGPWLGFLRLLVSQIDFSKTARRAMMLSKLGCREPRSKRHVWSIGALHAD